MKYLIAQPYDPHTFKPDGGPFAIVFSEKLLHRDVARMHSASRLAVIRGGFCSFNKVECHGLGVRVWGVAESCGKVSAPEDAQIIEDSLTC